MNREIEREETKGKDKTDKSRDRDIELSSYRREKEQRKINNNARINKSKDYAEDTAIRVLLVKHMDGG